MPQAAPAQHSFAGGEWGPMLYGRSDLAKYQVACKVVENFISTPQGPAVRRPGTRYVASAKNGGDKARLVPFEFNTTQAYILEFGDQYIRFYRNQGQILESAQNITGITQASPAEVSIAGHGYSTGDEVFIEGVGGMTRLNGRWFTITSTGTGTFTLDGEDSTGYDAYTSGGTAARVYEIASPYAKADLPSLRFVQSNDILTIVHNDYAPRELSRTGHTSWTLAEIDFEDGPYLSYNGTSTTLTPGGTTGSQTLTASATTGINGGDGFKSTDVGRLVRFRHNTSSAWGWAEITAFTSTTQVTVSIQKTLSGTTASTEWALGVWSDTTGWPAVATFYENRRVFGGSTDYPNRIDGSVIGDYANFTPDDQSSSSTVEADDAIAFTLASRKANVIRWMVEDEKGLFVGTSGGEWQIAASNNDAISAANPPRAKQSTTYGSADVEPVEAGRATLFVSKDKKRLRELAYIFEIDGFKAQQMTLLADQITLKQIDQLAYQQAPNSVVWCVLNDGTLAGFTYIRDQEVTAWHRHILGGTSDASGTQAEVESVAVIPAQDQIRDEPWVIVKRYVNGNTVRHIEFIETEWESDDAIADAFFVDGGLTYDGSATSTITGLDHLEGETVKVLVDGGTHDDKTVSSGSITLDADAEKVHVGLGQTCTLAPLPVEAGTRDGSPMGREKRITRVDMRVLNSSGGKMGPDDSDLTKIRDLEYYNPATTTWGSVPALYSGWARHSLDVGREVEMIPHFVNSLPLPSIVQAFRYTMEASQR